MSVARCLTMVLLAIGSLTFGMATSFAQEYPQSLDDLGPIFAGPVPGAGQITSLPPGDPCAIYQDSRGNWLSDCVQLELPPPTQASTPASNLTPAAPIDPDSVSVTNNQQNSISFGISHDGQTDVIALAPGETQTRAFAGEGELVGQVRVGEAVTTVTLKRGSAYGFLVVGAVYYLVAAN
jgi:hypothetical protein